MSNESLIHDNVYILPDSGRTDAGVITDVNVVGKASLAGADRVTEYTSKDYIDARVAEVRSDSRANLAEIKSLIDVKLSRLDKLPTLWQVVSAVVAAAVATVGLLLAILAYTGDRVDGTVQTASTLGALVERMDASARTNAKAIDDLRRENDRRLPIKRGDKPEAR